MAARALAAMAALLWSVTALAATQKPLLAVPDMTAAQVVAKNVAARGGLEAWRKIDSMAWIGHVESEGGSAAPMPFVLELGRPNRTRFEITTIDRRFVRIFDGTHGWRVRPEASGVPDVKPFSKEEAGFARDEFVIDGPLVDYTAKGVAIRLAGLDEVDGRKAYLLEVTLPSGANRRIWIDAKTFLDVRMDRPSTNPLVRGAPVSVYYGDYRSIDGVMIPHTIESRPMFGAHGTERLVIDRVALNPTLSPVAFAKPAVPRQRHAVVRAEPIAPSPMAGSGRPSP